MDCTVIYLRDCKMIEKFNRHIEESYNSCSWISLYYGNIEHLLNTLNSPTTYVEIGIAMGFHIETIAKKFSTVKCYGIDPYVPYDPTDSFNDIGKIEPSLSVQENFDLFCSSVTGRLGKYSNFNHIRQSSDSAFKLFQDESIDLIFVDGDHTYEAVKKDCNLWWSKLKSGGIMCWDDYAWPGVKQAVDEFAADNDIELKAITKNNRYYTIYSIKGH